MSTKIQVLNRKNIYVYKDCIQDLILLDKKNKSIFLEVSNPDNFSFSTNSSENKNSKLTIEINCEDFENICKEYLKYVKEKS